MISVFFVTEDGKEVAGFDKPTLTELENIQAQAMRL